MVRIFGLDGRNRGDEGAARESAKNGEGVTTKNIPGWGGDEGVTAKKYLAPEPPQWAPGPIFFSDTLL